MIRPPRRSVTRFFIPLIDVLTLLFCIFLLMPLVRVSGEPADSLPALEERIRLLEQDLQAAQAERKEPPRQIKEELDRLRKEKTERVKQLQERLKVRVLEIDPATGKLFDHDAKRVEVANQAEAHQLIDRDHKELEGSRRELYYLIRYPRGSSPFPLREQREQYTRWFADVAHGWDIPGAASPSGGTP